MPGVYVHLPFCPYLCPYCDFAKWPARASATRRYLDALYRELDRAPPNARRRSFSAAERRMRTQPMLSPNFSTG